jgi:hypothetical protein
MTTRLKIDLIQGVLEVEGSETFVKAIYNDFKSHFIGEEAGETPMGARARSSRRTASAKPAKPAPKTVPPEASSPPAPIVEEPVEPDLPEPLQPEHRIVDGLNLSAADGHPSLVEFMDSKFPITNEERNLVFLYYLQYTLQLKTIQADHLYTCYKAAKIRVPANLESSLQLTATRHLWIRVSKTGRLNVTPAGKLYLEKQLPKKRKS